MATAGDASLAPGKRAEPDLIRFGLLCLFLFALVEALPRAALAPVNRATALLAAWCLELCGVPAGLSGVVLTLDGFRVRIVTECTALYGLLLYGAFVLAVPAPPLARLRGLMAGALSLTAVNVLRIALVTMVGAGRPELFELLHVYFGQVVMILTVVALALAWQSQQGGREDTFPFIARAGVGATLLFLPWLALNRLYVALLDQGVLFLFALVRPEHILDIPRPPALFNHTFEVPLYLALLLASRVPLRRKMAGALAGVLVIAGWNALFRVTHVIWTAYAVEEMEPVHMLVYLIGQYLLPFLLWLLVAARPCLLAQRLGAVTARALPLLVLFVALAWPAPARAAATVVIEPGGRGFFNLRITGMRAVTGGDIRIQYEYDGRTLPMVEPGELVTRERIQALTDPGVIEIHFSTEEPKDGGGELASIRFPGRFTSLAGWLQREQGGTESARTRITNPPEEEKVEPEPPSPPGRDSAAAAAQVVRVSPEAAVLSGPATGQSAVPVDRQQQGSALFRRMEGALDRFCGHAGEWTPEALERVFAPVGDGEFRQEPSLFVTDGSAQMRVIFRVPREGEKVTCFLVRGAHCTSARIVGHGEWLLELVPHEGVTAASVTVQTTREMVEYPLTVVPPLALYDSEAASGEHPCRRDFVIAANMRAASE